MANERLGRRSWLTWVGGAALGAAAGGGLARAGEAAGGAATGMRALPWPYKPLDPDATGERAFKSYLKGHCMYGSFDAMVGQVVERLGEPYASFPLELFTYGVGGVQGWATLCGALNGSAAAFQLLAPAGKAEALTDALFAWYEREALPDFVPAGAKFANVKSVSGSPLCHQSVSAWCKVSGKKAYAPERKERCGVLTGAVARHAVELLNLAHAGKPLPVLVDAETQKCGSCHEKGGVLENTRTKMTCGGCHFHLGTKHPDI